MVSLSRTGEIADFQDVDQFQPARSQFECGYFAVAIVEAMNQVGQPPTQSVGQMIAEAESWYAQYTGSDSITNTSGMTVPQLYQLLGQEGLHYQALALDVKVIRWWITMGYPVIISGEEVGMYDMGLGDVVPYPWIAQGSHVIVLTGVTANGNFLVRDSANCTNLYDPNSLRPGPREYDASRLRLVSATAVVPHWLPRVPQETNPMPTIPTNWHDDGTTLTAPNGHKVIRGFREYILSHYWDPMDLPLEEEQENLNPVEESNPTLGIGSQQVFNWTMLEWTPSRGVFVAWVGQEFMKVRADKAALQAQVAALQAQLPTSHS